MTTENQAPEGGHALSDAQIDKLLNDLDDLALNFGDNLPGLALNSRGLERSRAVVRAALAAQPHPSAEAQAQHDNAVFERGYQHGRQQERQIQEARQAPAEGDVWALVESYAAAKVDCAANPAHESAKAYAKLAESNLREALAGFKVQPKHTAPGWADAYAAFQGAFDTPLARRRMDDEFSQDARRRLREFNEAVLAAQAPAPVDEVEELKAQNRAVAQLIIDNDKAGAVKWAQGLVASLDDMEVRAQAPAVQAENDPAEFEVWEGDELFAGTSGPRVQAWAELQRYAAQCEGVVRVFEVSRVERTLSYVPVQQGERP